MVAGVAKAVALLVLDAESWVGVDVLCGQRLAGDDHYAVRFHGIGLYIHLAKKGGFRFIYDRWKISQIKKKKDVLNFLNG